MILFQTKEQLAEWRKAQTRSIAFVPTMGYLHEGHLSLINRARELAEQVVVSIFVNRLQFNNPDDFNKYPVDHERDLQLLSENRVEAVYLPTEAEIYGETLPKIILSYPQIMKNLCGAFRPGHFEGVLLICYKFFRHLQPQVAVFGLKDYQQYRLVKKMALDLETGVEVVGSPLIRENNGLALSSRNARLSESGRLKALFLSSALKNIETDFYEKKIRNADILNENLLKYLSGNEYEYAGIYDLESLENLEGEFTSALVAVAGYVEGVRLIDNVLLTSS